VTARRELDEDYVARVKALEADRRRLAAGKGEQLALPILADVKVGRLATGRGARARGWVKP
jgi:hypothetical protein